MQDKDGTLNILSLDVSLISPQLSPQGLKWMKEEEVMKYMNDHEGEKKSWEEKAAALFIRLLWIRPFWSVKQLCAFLKTVYLRDFVLSLERPVSLRWLENLTNI